MAKNAWIVVVLLAVAGCGQQRADDLVIESGGCCGVSIGQSVKEVVDTLKARGVHDVSVDVETPIRVTSTSIDTIDTLSTAVGLCVTDHSGFGMDLAFDVAGALTDIELTPAAQGNSLGLQTGQERASVITRLKEELTKNAKLAVSNCLPKSRSIQLAQATQEDVEYLATHPAWTYHEPKGYSHARLVFADGRLKRIEYHERPFEE